jgi:hypothetical protein
VDSGSECIYIYIYIYVSYLPLSKPVFIIKKSFVTVNQISEITTFPITIATNCEALHECKLCNYEPSLSRF